MYWIVTIVPTSRRPRGEIKSSLATNLINFVGPARGIFFSDPLLAIDRPIQYVECRSSLVGGSYLVAVPWIRLERHVMLWGKLWSSSEGTEGSGRFSLWKPRKPGGTILRIHTGEERCICTGASGSHWSPLASVSSITLKRSEKKYILYR